MLLNKRLDLDIANTRLRKAHEADREARVSDNILPLSLLVLYTSVFCCMFIIPLSIKNCLYGTVHLTASQFQPPAFSICQNLNANPVEEDYLSHVSYMFSFLRVKWLKVSDVKQTLKPTGEAWHEACWFGLWVIYLSSLPLIHLDVGSGNLSSESTFIFACILDLL